MLEVQYILLDVCHLTAFLKISSEKDQFLQQNQNYGSVVQMQRVEQVEKIKIKAIVQNEFLIAFPKV